MNKKEQLTNWLIENANDCIWSLCIDADLLNTISPMIDREKIGNIYRSNIINGVYIVYFIETSEPGEGYIIIIPIWDIKKICIFINCMFELSEDITTNMLKAIKKSIVENENQFLDAILTGRITRGRYLTVKPGRKQNGDRT